VVANDDITDDGFRSIFATNLSEIMRIKGFGQAELAERTGLSSAMISKYLNQKATPSMTNLLKIARALNCHPDELYE
jgi:transcriptional regulator with XRE-family HTH domain